MTYGWDALKAAANAKKHGVTFEEASSVFLDPLALTFWDPDHSDEEDREISIGRSARQRVLFVAQPGGHPGLPRVRGRPGAEVRFDSS